MKNITFVKMLASGNDFVIINRPSSLPCRQAGIIYRLPDLAKKICDRKLGIGADGLLVLEKSKKADVRMRIFNPDGSEPAMCGNGARCVALYQTKRPLPAGRQERPKTKDQIKIETKAGVIESELKKDNIKIRLTDPTNIKLDIPIKINNRQLKVSFINTGVPHVIIFVKDLYNINIINIGRNIRYHKKFMPEGTNADFVEIVNKNTIKMRTYERGVEDETLACGTGAVASALIFVYRLSSIVYRNKINIYTKSGEVLKVYFERINNEFKNVWLEGKVKLVYKGEFYF